MKIMWKIALTMLTALAAILPGGGRAEPTEASVSCGAWIVYWDAERGLDEMVALDPLPDRLIAFEALFDTDGTVILESGSEALLSDMQRRFPAERIWLSVVNDLKRPEGGYANKDRQLLRELMMTPEAREAHIRELVSLAQRWQLKGLEIDYENIRSDTEIWEGYTVFLQDLHAALAQRGVALRVCLEWDSIRYADLPRGPQYSIMCYNLYGSHSGPGPKADRSFLERVAELYQGRDDCAMALATGGFDWLDDRVERGLTEKEADGIFRSRNLRPTRDPDSGVLYGSYLQDGQTHTVWYADAETLWGWMEILQEYGFTKFDLFRLGGNTAADWNEVILSHQAPEGGGQP